MSRKRYLTCKATKRAQAIFDAYSLEALCELLNGYLAGEIHVQAAVRKPRKSVKACTDAPAPSDEEASALDSLDIVGTS